MFRSAMPAALAAAAARIAPQAIAHSYPQTASPPVNGTVTTTPGQVPIVFTEGIEPRLSSIEVTDPKSQRVDEGAAHRVDGDAKRFAIGVKTLAGLKGPLKPGDSFPLPLTVEHAQHF
jgi:methionine-rich copper-binding protein CopC